MILKSWTNSQGKNCYKCREVAFTTLFFYKLYKWTYQTVIHSFDRSNKMQVILNAGLYLRQLPNFKSTKVNDITVRTDSILFVLADYQGSFTGSQHKKRTKSNRVKKMFNSLITNHLFARHKMFIWLICIKGKIFFFRFWEAGCYACFQFIQSYSYSKNGYLKTRP